MNAYKIVKVYGQTHTGRVIGLWDVTDAKDGYVYDTFSRKCDAVAWVAASTK
jgi:hypothetical protein